MISGTRERTPILIFSIPSHVAPAMMLSTSTNRKDMADDHMSQPRSLSNSFSLGETLSSRLSQNNNEKSLGKSMGKRKTNHHHDDDILFDMEGYSNDKDCEPFFESDDESSGEWVLCFIYEGGRGEDKN